MKEKEGRRKEIRSECKRIKKVVRLHNNFALKKKKKRKKLKVGDRWIQIAKKRIHTVRQQG